MQLEPIIAAKLKTFQERFELSNIQSGVAFGKFVNHTILSIHKPDAFLQTLNYWRKLASMENGIALATQAKEDIAALTTYETPDIHFIDSEALKSLCDLNDNRFDVTIGAHDIMELTPVEKVENSCIAVCYGSR